MYGGGCFFLVLFVLFFYYVAGEFTSTLVNSSLCPGEIREMTLWNILTNRMTDASPKGFSIDTPVNCHDERMVPEFILDGAKWVCGLPFLFNAKPIIYSLGCGGSLDFEIGLEKYLGSNYEPNFFVVDAGDYGNMQYFSHANFHYMKARIGIEKSHISLSDFIHFNKHTNLIIDILKIDIEGAEVELILQELREFSLPLPFIQMQIEFHKDGAIFDKMQEELFDMGMWSFHRDPNKGCYECFEIAYVNIYSSVINGPGCIPRPRRNDSMLDFQSPEKLRNSLLKLQHVCRGNYGKQDGCGLFLHTPFSNFTITVDTGNNFLLYPAMQWIVLTVCVIFFWFGQVHPHLSPVPHPQERISLTD